MLYVQLLVNGAQDGSGGGVAEGAAAAAQPQTGAPRGCGGRAGGRRRQRLQGAGGSVGGGSENWVPRHHRSCDTSINGGSIISVGGSGGGGGGGGRKGDARAEAAGGRGKRRRTGERQEAAAQSGLLSVPAEGGRGAALPGGSKEGRGAHCIGADRTAVNLQTDTPTHMFAASRLRAGVEPQRQRRLVRAACVALEIDPLELAERHHDTPDAPYVAEDVARIGKLADRCDVPAALRGIHGSVDGGVNGGPRLNLCKWSRRWSTPHSPLHACRAAEAAQSPCQPPPPPPLPPLPPLTGGARQSLTAVDTAVHAAVDATQCGAHVAAIDALVDERYELLDIGRVRRVVVALRQPQRVNSQSGAGGPHEAALPLRCHACAQTGCSKHVCGRVRPQVHGSPVGANALLMRGPHVIEVLWRPLRAIEVVPARRKCRAWPAAAAVAAAAEAGDVHQQTARQKHALLNDIINATRWRTLSCSADYQQGEMKPDGKVFRGMRQRKADGGNDAHDAWKHGGYSKPNLVKDDPSAAAAAARPRHLDLRDGKRQISVSFTCPAACDHAADATFGAKRPAAVHRAEPGGWLRLPKCLTRKRNGRKCGYHLAR
ncbi:hypothetical protein JKP88DRAFT_268244 [Tribonema minus]|uniref:Uncharacterized protein n=1 Tax=Tribonema minus TaxID=303371 RepID=A0A835Z680_9STRA|nr:hypothetical protein JKP88DRAFT_268244 [Tribonema minus]